MRLEPKRQWQYTWSGRTSRKGPIKTQKLLSMLFVTIHRHFVAVLDSHERDNIFAAFGEDQFAVGGMHHIADDASTCGDYPGLEFFCFGIEAHERIGPDSGFPVPDDPVHNGDSVRPGFSSAWGKPLGGHLTGFGVETA